MRKEQHVRDLEAEILLLKTAHKSEADAKAMLMLVQEENENLKRILDAHKVKHGCKLGLQLLADNRAEESVCACGLNSVPASDAVTVATNSTPSKKELAGRTQEEMDLKRRAEHLREGFQQLPMLVDSYVAASNRIESIMGCLDVFSLRNGIETLINESFDASRPHVVVQAHSKATDNPTWTDLIRKDITDNPIERCDGIYYRYCTGGKVVEMSQLDHYVICSGVLQKLLRAVHELMQREWDTQYLQRIDLTRLSQERLQGERHWPYNILCSLQLTLAVFDNISMILQVLRGEIPSAGSDAHREQTTQNHENRHGSGSCESSIAQKPSMRLSCKSRIEMEPCRRYTDTALPNGIVTPANPPRGIYWMLNQV